ncbi:hypothetical protein Lser_V15G40712 [Lactuca serriola]
MGNQSGLGLHLIFIFVLLVATSCLGFRNKSGVCSEQERFALLNFKQSVRDDYGMLSSWVGNDCCMWEGIHCDNVTGNVEGLNLRASFSYTFDERYSEFVGEGYLAGNEANSSLAELRHLKYLDLSGNDFEGSQIPEFIGSFKQLSYLNLSHAGFEGIISHHIGNLSNLKVLDLSSNQNMMADNMVWTAGLSSLEHLDLSKVNLSGTHNFDMVLYMIPSLKVLSLSYCGLSNSDLGASHNFSRILPNIKHLDLSFNSLKGPLPDFFLNMTSLAFLDLSGYNISLAWNFANLLSMIPSLSVLHLSFCRLDNTHLSSPHLNLSTLSNIQHLDLRDNSISGIFPSILTNMSSLRVLDLSENMLNSSVAIMPNLLELYLSFNEFKHIEPLGIWRQCYLKQLIAAGNDCDIELIDSPKNMSECSQYSLEMLDLRWSSNGTIPEGLGTLTNLRGLLISESKLTGVSPKSLGRLRFLEVLDLSLNHLTGPIPTFLGKLSKLDLSSNLLNGTIPVSIGQHTNLHYLDISDNSLKGVVFEVHFANLSMLKCLAASSNTKLTFNFSRDWIPPFQLLILRLGSCNVGNGFPKWLQNQRKLGVLVLSNATISGPLPTWLRKMPIIPFLDLSRNKLKGPLTNLPSGGEFNVSGHGFGQALFLQNNLFDEKIPSSMCRTYLEYLDLSRNRLIGKIPRCLENLQKLNALILSSNRWSGVIPSFISLFRLHLNGNNFTGELPREMMNFQSLAVLDLGDNNYHGNIPQCIGEKLNPMVLRLQRNNFSGKIPRSFCRLSNLQILDVAHNSLTGTIPRCLGQLSGMVNRNPNWRLISPDSDENVIQVMKGVDVEYTTTWDLVLNMDLSSNKLVGEIPVELTRLSMLMGLNLSNNLLSGGIPNNIGNMTKLESVDFSRNELTGMIPPSIEALTFLSHLNLSHNHLSG